MSEAPRDYDVVIAGGGPAGLAAGLFTARHELRTLIVDRGSSLLRQCAYLDNYLGFPGGIDATEFLDRARAHALDAGCEVTRQRVTALERVSHDGSLRFLVHTRSGTRFVARRFIAANGGDAKYLQPLQVPELLDPQGQIRPDAIDAYGRSPVEGLYVAGLLAGADNQALISAGHAAQVALALMHDIRRAKGLWNTIAHDVDWQFWRGTCDSQNWAERARRYFEDSVPSDTHLDASEIRAIIEHWIASKRAMQLDRAEVARRRERGLRTRRERSRAPSASVPELAGRGDA